MALAGNQQVDLLIKQAKKYQPQVIVSDITGDHNTWFLGSGIDKKEAALIELDASAVIGDERKQTLMVRLN